MVNYKRVVCEVAVFAFLAAIAAAAPTHDCKQDHYDQRQNGTENIRMNVDGVIIAVAPAEAFVAAASGINFGDLFEEFNEIQKPKPPTASSPPKPDDSKPGEVVAHESKPPTPEKPEAPLSEITVDTTLPETKGQKKDAGRKPVKGQRLKTLLANMLVPLLKRSQSHDS